MSPEGIDNADSINHHDQMAGAVDYLHKVHVAIAQAGVATTLANLIMLRVSQINGCAFCVKMHTEDARKTRETNERLDRLVVFRHVDDFDPAEKAALCWAESLTELNQLTDYPALRSEMRQHFSEKTISAITLLVGMINLWNRVGVSNH